MDTKQCKICGAVMTRKPTTRDVIWKLTTMCSTGCAIQANLRTGYQLKATGPDGERLYRRESYNHSTRATFSHFVTNAAMDAYIVPPTTGAGRSVGKGWKKI